MMRSYKWYKQSGALLASLSVAWGITSANAQLLNLQDMPLFVGAEVPSNLIVTYDDSGSMLWAFMPDSIETVDGSDDEPEAKSSVYNKIYYDPAIDYRPPLNSLGVEFADADFFAADPLFYGADNNRAGLASPVNLSSSFRPYWNLLNNNTWGPAFASDNGNSNAQAAYYYNYVPTNANCDASNLRDDDCYTKVVVSATSGPSRARPEFGGAVSTDERTNFANWFQWYSYRNLAGKTSLSRAFTPSKVRDSIRLARQTINRRGPRSGNPGWDNFGGNTHVAAFNAQERAYFYNWIWNIQINGGTPLRRALIAAGDHFSQDSSSADSPYRIAPGNSSSPELSCRANTHIMLTDGNWNNSFSMSGVNRDQANSNLPENIGGVSQYVADAADTQIYYHGEATTNLADLAFHYWINDLRTDLNNNVPTNYVEVTLPSGEPQYPQDFWNPVNDPATWQHMRNYMIAFGTAGRVPLTEQAYKALLTGTPYTDTQGNTRTGWPSTGNADFRTDDVYHAAVNSRGAFFSAQNPNELVNALSDAAKAASGDGSVTTITANSGNVSTDSLLYQARFNTETWTGDLIAYEVSDGSGVTDPSVTGCNASPLGTLCNPAWNAAERSDASFINASTRSVFTYLSTASVGADPAGSGIDFNWSGGSTALNATQQSWLNDDDGLGEERVQYLRGDSSNEGILFKQRSVLDSTSNGSRLGPVVHSSPVYAGRGVDANGSRQFNFPDDLESASYSTFLSSIAGRPEMVYVGSNDGMLHAYNASDSSAGGRELFAYVPGPVIENLHDLTELNFRSGAFVDGPLRVQDVFYGGGWETLLVGGLRTGGQGYFALEVTAPQSATAANIVRWEFTDDNDADLGYTFGAPLLVRANNGQWVAIVANGYNSAESDGRPGSGRAVLFVLDAETGQQLGKFTVGSSTANGLSSPVAISADGDYNVDYVYAGDLQGNLWKFDMSSSNPADWNSSNASLLFSTGGSNQPIIAAPTVGTHPANRGGRVVYFGTGQYMASGDVSSTDQQSFYAIWDKDNGSVVSSSSLLTQTVSSSANDVRQTTENTIDWATHNGWELRLDGGSGGPAERVIGKASLLGGVVVFASVVPSGDVCEGNIESFLYGVDRNDGGSYAQQVFDRTNDGIIDSSDRTSGGQVANVFKLDSYADQPVYLGADAGDQGVLYSGEDPTVVDNFGISGRIRWRQLQ